MIINESYLDSIYRHLNQDYIYTSDPRAGGTKSLFNLNSHNTHHFKKLARERLVEPLDDWSLPENDLSGSEVLKEARARALKYEREYRSSKWRSYLLRSTKKEILKQTMPLVWNGVLLNYQCS